MGTMEGFFLGQMLAPIPNGEHNEAEKAWRARAKREEERADEAEERAEAAENQLVAMKERAEAAEERAEKAEKQVGNLTVSLEKEHAALEKEHNRFLLERRKRVGYMKGWAIRGKILTDSCGYSIERMDAESDILEEKYSEKLKEIVLKESDKIDQESGF
jgi:hypothetical protein